MPAETETSGSTGAAPWLLTPGPLSTDRRTRQAMLQDWGSWDADFKALTASVRSDLLAEIGNHPDFDCVPMQGSGTFAVESMLGTLIPANDSRTLVLSNGAYGQRIARTLACLNRDHVLIDKGDVQPPRGAELDDILRQDPTITHVVIVHCETSSGILNPLAEIAAVAEQHRVGLLIDAMSSFGAIPIDPDTIRFDALVSSANKCFEGVPGFGFIIARKALLAASEGNAHSLSLDAHAQWEYMQRTGQWRFTPPTHCVAAFAQALSLHRAEGGSSGRLLRYSANRDVLLQGMQALGFRPLLEPRWLSPIIVSFHAPDHPAYDFGRFYNLLKSRGFIIYPGKLTEVDSFRIGCIGALDSTVMQALVGAVEWALETMQVTLQKRPA